MKLTKLAVATMLCTASLLVAEDVKTANTPAPVAKTEVKAEKTEVKADAKAEKTEVKADAKK